MWQVRHLADQYGHRQVITDKWSGMFERIYSLKNIRNYVNIIKRISVWRYVSNNNVKGIFYIYDRNTNYLISVFKID